MYYPHGTAWLVFGPALIVVFAVYFAGAAWAIVQGVLTAPEDSDSDSDDSDDDDDDREDEATVDATTALLPGRSEAPQRRSGRRSLLYHTAYLVFGFGAIGLAGYVLSQAAINIVDAFEMSDVLFSVIILALATTLPEKFVAVISAHLGQPGILVANCAGSNIFLLSLCAGIIMASTRGELDRGNIAAAELGVLWASTAAFTATVWFGARFARPVGAAMLVAYVAFIVLEFTVVHR